MMMDDTMTDKLNDAREAIKVALRRCEAGRDEWIQGTIELARHLNETKKLFPSTIEFGLWLDASGFKEKPSHQDRAALISIGEQNPMLVARVLRGCQTMSWRLAWEEEMEPVVIELRLTSAGNSEETTPSPAPVAKSAEVMTLIRPLTARTPLAQMPRAQEVARVFIDKNSRISLGKLIDSRKAKSDGWALILECLDAGFYPRPVDSEIRTTNLRMIFPWVGGRGAGFPSRYDLTRAKDRERIRRTVIPAIKERLADCLANPDIVEGLVRAYEQKVRREDNEKASAEEVKRKREGLVDGQVELVFYGTRVWPQTDVEANANRYDYTTLSYALRHFQVSEHDISQLPGHTTAASIAQKIRIRTNYPMRYVEVVLPIPEANRANAMFRVVHFLTRLYETANGQGECSPFPLIIDVV